MRSNWAKLAFDKSMAMVATSMLFAFTATAALAGGAPNAAQMGDAEKVAHAYVDAWKAGDYNKAIVLADHGNVSITGVRCAEQNSKYNLVTEILQWGKPEVVLGECVAIPFSVNATSYEGVTRKQDWWIGLVNDDGQWKVMYTNGANIKPLNLNYVDHKAATIDDGQPQYKFSLNQFNQKVAAAKKK